jgi:N-acetyltransferase
MNVHTLQDEIVALVPLNKAQHLPALIPYAINEPTTWRYSIQSPGGSAAGMESYIDYAVEQMEQQKQIVYVIQLVKTGEIVGCTRFYNIDLANSNAAIGYTWYGEQHRRTGINRRCKLLLLTYAFEMAQLQRVEFMADINNHISIKAMKAIGCVEEGVLRQHAKVNDGWRTSMILSILKDDWYSHTKQHLQSIIR